MRKRFGLKYDVMRNYDCREIAFKRVHCVARKTAVNQRIIHIIIM